MTWGRKSNRKKHRQLGQALSAALSDREAATLDRPSTRALGSRGGAPIWIMKEMWMPSPCTCGVAGPATGPSIDCPRHGPRRKRAKEGGRWGPRQGPDSPPYRQALAGGHERGFPNGPKAPAYEGPRGIPYVTDEQAEGDPDGFAVFGRYPKGWLSHVIRLRFLGDVRRDEILHVCSGTLGPVERWTVDLRLEARPSVVANGCQLPFRDASFEAVMLDPPYTDAYARNLYGTENPRPSWLLKEAARVVVPGGRVGMMHVAVPFAPPGCHLVTVEAITIGPGFRVRAFTVYERGQPELPW